MKIAQVTLAVSNSLKMADFYRKVFDMQFKESDAMGEKIYTGAHAGLKFMLCPNSLAGVDAKQSRHQFDYDINDLDEIIKNAVEAGGSIMGEVMENDGQKYATIIDPDGNTMNFYQVLI